MAKLNGRAGVLGSVVAGAVLMGGMVAPRQAEAALILAFGQQGTGITITGTSSGGRTTISGSDVPITITALDGYTGPAISAYFNLLAVSQTVASMGTSGNTRQEFNGSFAITSGTGLTGTGYLWGNFVDLFEARNDSATMQASTPAASNVTFNSQVISQSDLGLDRSLSFSLTSVNPNITGPNANGTTPDFTASIAGTFSADTITAVPEPMSMALLGVGLLGTGLAARRRSV